jgi:hypothetical protein
MVWVGSGLFITEDEECDVALMASAINVPTGRSEPLSAPAVQLQPYVIRTDEQRKVQQNDADNTKSDCFRALTRDIQYITHSSPPRTLGRLSHNTHYEQNHARENPSSSSHSGPHQHYLRPTSPRSEPDYTRNNRFSSCSQSKTRRVCLRRGSWSMQAGHLLHVDPCNPPCWALHSQTIPTSRVTSQRLEARHCSVGQLW